MELEVIKHIKLLLVLYILGYEEKEINIREGVNNGEERRQNYKQEDKVEKQMTEGRRRDHTTKSSCSFVLIGKLW